MRVLGIHCLRVQLANANLHGDFAMIASWPQQNVF
jgi:hypothetical protein